MIGWKQIRGLCLSSAMLLVAAAPVAAQPFEVPIDPAASSMAVELCVMGTCDSDSTPIAGSITIALDALTAPSEISLHDFELQATEALHVVVDLGFITGRLEATATGLSTSYAGVSPMGPVPINANLFMFLDVPAGVSGTVELYATKIICIMLNAAGICPSCPCTVKIDLSQQGTQYGDLTGSVTANNGLVTLSGQMDTTIPLDPNNPSLGHLRVTSFITGEVQVQTALCGDANCDGTFNGADIDAFFLALGDPAAWQAQYPGCDLLGTCDINGDGAVNGADIDPFFVALGLGYCP